MWNLCLFLFTCFQVLKNCKMDCTCFKQCPINKEEILWKNGICKSSKSKRCFSGQRALCASACALHLPNPFPVATRNSDAIPRAPQRNVLSGVLRALNLLHLHSLPVKLNSPPSFPSPPFAPTPQPRAVYSENLAWFY